MMDTSEQYIRMTDCPEIQDCRPDIQGLVWCTGICHEKLDTYWQKPGPLVFPGPNSRKVVWLPRQDQLQDMVRHHHRCDIQSWLVEDFASWCRNRRSLIARETSMEQLWLGFVKHDKFEKVWDEEAWVNA